MAAAGWPVGRKHSDESCLLMGATRLGIDPSEYRAKREAGLRWCTGHKRWEPSADFVSHPGKRDGIGGQCVESNRAISREYQRRKARAKQHTGG